MYEIQYKIKVKSKIFKHILSTIFFAVLFLFLTFAFSYPPQAFAESNYGEGSYSGGVFGATTPETTVPGDDTFCSDSTPTGIDPWLYSANANDGSSVTIRFTNWQSPVNHFALEYGTEPGNYQFGVSNIGEKDTNSYTIRSLSANKTYYFRIRTGNGCAVGSWSNEISVKTLNIFSFKTIDITDTAIQTSEGEDISTGDEEGEAEDGDVLEGFNVNIKVTDQELKPVEGAIVTLHSDPKEATTNENGVATFTGIEQGEHRVIIAYNNYEGGQTINLTPDENTKEFNINITIQTKNILFSKEVITIVGISVLVITILLVLLIKAKKKKT